MKINGPGQPPVTGVPGQGSPDGPADGVEGKRGPGSTGTAPTDKTSKSGKSFAEAVSGVAGARPTAASALDRPTAVAVHDLVEELRAGRLEGRQAVDKVIDRVVTAQLGPDAPTHVRDKVQAALRDAVEDDPLLAEKLRGL